MSIIKRLANKVPRKSRGQGLVEFALISVILFLLVLGILEFGRLLFVYNVLSNAAQEGSRYGIVRPRDVITSSGATQTAVAGGPRYTAIQVVGDGACNVIDKTREKVAGIPSSAVKVSVWYDNGDGTPIVPTTSTPSPYDTRAMITGNRVVVEATYHFNFLDPLIASFVPNGMDIRMRSARTIMNNGDTPQIQCALNMTPAAVPTSPPSPTSTPVYPTSTATATTMPPPPAPTDTNTPVPGLPTNTPRATPTPRTLVITSVTAVVGPGNGGNAKLNVQVNVTDGSSPFAGATVIVDTYVDQNPRRPYVQGIPVPSSGNGLYDVCPAGLYRGGDYITVDVTVSAPGYIGATRTNVVARVGNNHCPR